MRRENEIQEGIEKGIEKGLEKGIQEGIKKEKIEIAIKLKKMGFDVEDIAKSTELTTEFIKKL